MEDVVGGAARSRKIPCKPNDDMASAGRHQISLCLPNYDKSHLGSCDLS